MNTIGQKLDTRYPLMGTIKVPADFVGKGKLQPGVRKVDSKAMSAFLESVREGDGRLGIPTCGLPAMMALMARSGLPMLSSFPAKWGCRETKPASPFWAMMASLSGKTA